MNNIEFKTVTIDHTIPAKPNFDKEVNKLMDKDWRPVFESYVMNKNYQSIVLWRRINT